jgi:hypothetical protein
MLILSKDDDCKDVHDRQAMSSNGKRHPPRPALELIAPGAGPQEAAVIAAALEQFLHDTAPPPLGEQDRGSPWARAALAEGVGLEAPTPWGDSLAWGR